MKAPFHIAVMSAKQMQASSLYSVYSYYWLTIGIWFDFLFLDLQITDLKGNKTLENRA